MNNKLSISPKKKTNRKKNSHKHKEEEDKDKRKNATLNNLTHNRAVDRKKKVSASRTNRSKSKSNSNFEIDHELTRQYKEALKAKKLMAEEADKKNREENLQKVASFNFYICKDEETIVEESKKRLEEELKQREEQQRLEAERLLLAKKEAEFSKRDREVPAKKRRYFQNYFYESPWYVEFCDQNGIDGTNLINLDNDTFSKLDEAKHTDETNLISYLIKCKGGYESVDPDHIETMLVYLKHRIAVANELYCYRGHTQDCYGHLCFIDKIITTISQALNHSTLKNTYGEILQKLTEDFKKHT